MRKVKDEELLSELAGPLREVFPMARPSPAFRSALRERLIEAARSAPYEAKAARPSRPWLLGAAFLSALGLALYARRSGWHLPQLSLPGAHGR